MKTSPKRVGWTFLTNHALVLIQVWHSPDMTVRTIARQVGVTERAAHRILAALVKAGYIDRRRVGRNNYYFVEHGRPMRHPQTAHVRIERLIEAIGPLPPKKT